MPPFIPAPSLMVALSGIAEIILGTALFIPSMRVYAAWGVMALLLAVFPANIYMYLKGGEAFGVSNLALLIRLPVQFLLIYWAYIYTRI